LSPVQTLPDGARDLAVSPDGKNVYAAIGALDVYTRNTTTGALTFLEREEDGVAGVDNFRRNFGVAISPDGNCVYGTSEQDDAVVAFSRGNVDGSLTFVEFEKDGVGGVVGLVAPAGVVVSPDDLHVYVAAEPGTGGHDGGILVFSRGAPGCALTYVQTQTAGGTGIGTSQPPHMAFSPDGAQLYATGSRDGHGVVTVLDRDSMTGHIFVTSEPTDGENGVQHMAEPLRDIAVSADGANVYVASEQGDSVVVFSRAPDGVLTFVEAQRRGGFNDFDNPHNVVVSPDGAYVYVATDESNTVVVFRRTAATGALRFLEVRPNVSTLPYAIAVSPAGDSVYTATSGHIAVFAVDACGNGNLGVDELCDDGNVTGGDGCSPSCRLELCGALPSAGCRGTLPLAASLKIRDATPDKSDQLQFTWGKGEPTALADFGDPTASASYALCVYDGSGNSQPILDRAAPAGGICKNGVLCWQAKTTSYKYKDGLLLPDGIKQIVLKEGLLDGKARIQFKAAGPNLLPPALPLTLPVTVQVKNTDTGVCWEAVFPAASTNDASQFKAKGD
jgi:cysteine-rich repeat protein